MCISSPKIIIQASSLKEEFSSLKYVLKQLQFYKDNGYTVSLPDNLLLQDPEIIKDSDRMFSIFEKSEYDASYFTEGLKTLSVKVEAIERLIKKLIRLKDLWDFKVFPEYTVLLTKYGPGGSYHPNKGEIIMLARKDGLFRRDDPVETIVHEAVHMGVEKSIIEKYGLAHWEKERLVDLIVKTIFSEEFPNYRLQSKSDNRMDKYINLESINVLPQTIESYKAI